MKNRRITIFFTAALVLVGTPRVWQEAGNLLDFIQRKAQLKFLGMVMEPKERAAEEAELVAGLQQPEIQTALLETNCPLERVTSTEAQASSGAAAAERRAAPRRIRTQRRASEPVAAHNGSALLASKTRTQSAERLRQSANIKLAEPVWIAENVPSL